MQIMMCYYYGGMCSYQSAMGWEYQADLSKHSSQTDAAKGFGGKFGVQKENQDKVQYSPGICVLLSLITLCQSAKGWDYQSELSKHESQTDAAKGFGGKFGVQKEKQDKVWIQNMSSDKSYWYFLFEQSAVGWDYQAELSKHDSQKDASKGFGGKYGVEKDKQDQVSISITYLFTGAAPQSRSHDTLLSPPPSLPLFQSAEGWEYQTSLSKHGSQVDAAKGFGGKYGVESDRQDQVCMYYLPYILHNVLLLFFLQSAGSYDDMQGVQSSYKTDRGVKGMFASHGVKGMFASHDL